MKASDVLSIPEFLSWVYDKPVLGGLALSLVGFWFTRYFLKQFTERDRIGHRFWPRQERLSHYANNGLLFPLCVVFAGYAIADASAGDGTWWRFDQYWWWHIVLLLVGLGLGKLDESPYTGGQVRSNSKRWITYVVYPITVWAMYAPLMAMVQEHNWALWAFCATTVLWAVIGGRFDRTLHQQHRYPVHVSKFAGNSRHYDTP